MACGNLAGCAVDSTIMGVSDTLRAARRRAPTAVCGSIITPVSSQKAANGHLGLMLTDRMGGEQRAQLGKLALLEMERARWREARPCAP